jgi:opacity protein-like surface antigen
MREFMRAPRAAAVLSMIMLGATGTAAAATPGLYVTGTLGQSAADVSQSDKDSIDDVLVAAWNQNGFTVLANDSSLDKSDLGYELAVGYQISERFALEAAYIDLGEATYDADSVVDSPAPGGPYDAVTEITFGVSGPAFSAVGGWSLTSRLSLDARVGVFMGKSKLGVNLAADGVSEDESESDSSSSLLFGAGVSWSFSEKAAVRLGYTYFQEAVFEEFNVGRLSLGLRYGF